MNYAPFPPNSEPWSWVVWAKVKALEVPWIPVRTSGHLWHKEGPWPHVSLWYILVCDQAWSHSTEATLEVLKVSVVLRDIWDPKVYSPQYWPHRKPEATAFGHISPNRIGVGNIQAGLISEAGLWYSFRTQLNPSWKPKSLLQRRGTALGRRLSVLWVLGTIPHGPGKIKWPWTQNKLSFFYIVVLAAMYVRMHVCMYVCTYVCM